jgi:hypothetical protein
METKHAPANVGFDRERPDKKQDRNKTEGEKVWRHLHLQHRQHTTQKEETKTITGVRKSLHCLQLDLHDADRPAGHKRLEDRPDHHKETQTPIHLDIFTFYI